MRIARLKGRIVEGGEDRLDDALTIMRDYQEAHEAFERWVLEVGR